MLRQRRHGWMLTCPQVYFARLRQRITRLQRQRARVPGAQAQNRYRHDSLISIPGAHRVREDLRDLRTNPISAIIAQLHKKRN